MPEQSNDYRVVVFGAGGVGKSSLVLRFVKGTFRESYIPTVEDTYRQVCCVELKKKQRKENNVKGFLLFFLGCCCYRSVLYTYATPLALTERAA